MNRSEAKIILDKELNLLRNQSHEELQKLLTCPLVVERTGESGASYQMEILALWDNPRDEGGNLRVFGSIDDGGFLSAFRPVSADYVITSDGKILGE
jgi:hypothetical protein